MLALHAASALGEISATCDAITGGGGSGEVNAVSHGTKGHPMGIIGLAIIAATAFGGPSALRLCSRGLKADVHATSASISPHVIMWQKPPSEYWSHPY
jgi:hypothetical protein